MVRILIFIIALILLLVSYYLFSKKAIFFSLINETEKNKNYLNSFGRIYIFLAILGIVVAIFNERFLAFMFLILVILIASVFSLTFAKKMSAPRQ
ncbi:MAG: hypothetical protein ACK5NA_04820 [Enterococcus sp.]